jgi:hypothetical protein
MFLFSHSKQEEKNKNYYKGILFEELLQVYLKKSGYDVELRKKHSSLEYDLEGVSPFTTQKIVGEAKAHNKNMSGQDVAAFFGKLVPLGLMDKKVHGLFLSLSPLTPEAEDFYSSVEHHGLTTKVGKVLYNGITEALGLPEDNTLEKDSNLKGYDLFLSNILKTDIGVFKLNILREKNKGTPTTFSVYNSDGVLIQDKLFFENLKNNLPELSGLDFLLEQNDSNQNQKKQVTREILSGLTLGTDWADYRLPAGPSVFVGRKKFLDKVSIHISSEDIPHVIQIKSRSGVGKSSFISYLENKLSLDGYPTELHDSRDVKTIYDVFSLIGRFTKSKNTPTNFLEVDQQLKILQESLGQSKAIFFVDQFESTFTNSDIYECYEYIADSITRIKGNIYIVFARKNDQLTTYDDSKISLNRINSLSKNYTLPDFEPSEAILLIEKINESNENILSKEILPYILEFAQGFPWLLKRTIAHVLKLAKQGDSQRDLIGVGLKLDDLFEEELEGLDEIERDYLPKIAAKLPADLNELHVLFDEDPRLAKILDKLTTSRLVRLSGSTYDTYNDVFKEYLVYKKLPEFRPITIYRMYPKSVISQFHKLIKLKNITKFDIYTIKSELDVSSGTAFNLVKELRNLDLLGVSKAGEWVIPTNVMDIYSQGKLAGYLRRRLTDNQLVEGLLRRILSGDKVYENDISLYFSRSYPFIEASEKTWSLYSTILKSWLLALKLIEIRKNGELSITAISHTNASIELGNLKSISGIRSLNKGLFLPLTSLSMMRKVTEMIIKGIEPDKREEIKAKSDLKNAGVLVDEQLAVSNANELDAALLGRLQGEEYNVLWEAINLGNPCYKIFIEIIGGTRIESTNRFYLRKLTGLAKKLELIPNKRFPY